MAYQILSPEEFLDGEVLREDDFLRKATGYDWEKFRRPPGVGTGLQIHDHSPMGVSCI